MKGISIVQVERDSTNARASVDANITPVLPHQLVQLRGREFSQIVLKHHEHLREFWTEEDIEQIERDFCELRNAYKYEQALQSKLDDCNDLTGFEDEWKIVGDRFMSLRDFCGGIATAFPNTAAVESDFSVLGWEKDEYRLELSDLYLEGILQSKQFNLLTSLAA